ncbi:hypothetical protein JCM1841_004518 [Sporobolomyces salmonicolor]
MVAPHHPDRAKLVAQIKNLQSHLARLDRTLPPDDVRTPPEPAALAASPTSPPPAPTGKKARKARQDQGVGPLPPSLANAPKRHIALLFSYEGWAHSGLAYQPKGVYTPLPTVEGCLLEALEKSRLIEPITEGEGFGCGFERCGRTDAGVSSSAQVINLWVRSDLDDPMGTKGKEVDPTSVEAIRAARSRSPSPTRSRSSSVSSSSSTSTSSQLSFDLAPRKPAAPVEIPYIALLNRHLPPSIRIHAWSPVSASFSSRFSCIWRHYKYFFSASPVAPFLGSADQFDYGEAYRAAGVPEHARGWQDRLRGVDWGSLQLDVDLMRDAVARLVGEHDFRNFCKVDPPKQLKTHQRTVISASIDPVEGEDEATWVLNLRGGAFLYNQVRHIVAILFLVGARLEPPSIVDRLLWTSDRTSSTIAKVSPAPSEELDRKPGYQMAEDLPLILWQCGFNSTELDWRTDNVPRPSDHSFTPSALEPFIDSTGRLKATLDPHETFRKMFLEMNETYTQYRLRSIVLKHHLASFAFHAPPASPWSPLPSSSASSPSSPSPSPSRPRSRSPSRTPVPTPTFTPLGAGRTARTTAYIPLLSRARSELPETLNARWAAGRGAARMQRRVENQAESDRLREVHLKIKRDAIELAKRLEQERVRDRGRDRSEVDVEEEQVEGLRSISLVRGGGGGEKESGTISSSGVEGTPRPQ